MLRTGVPLTGLAQIGRIETGQILQGWPIVDHDILAAGGDEAFVAQL